MHQTTSKIGVISIIPSRRGYEDRLKMLDELGRFVPKHLIISKDDQLREGESARQAEPASEMILLSRANGPKFIWKAYREVQRFIKSSPEIDNWIVHDYLSLWTSPLLKLHSRGAVTTSLSLYFPNITILRRRGWREADGSRLPLSKEIAHHSRYIRRSILEYIGGFTSDVIIANSETISNEISGLPLLKSKAIHTMQTEVDTSVFYPGRIVSNTPSLSFHILYVGSFGSRKGLSMLLRAFADITKEGVNATLVLVGHDPTSEEMMRFNTLTNGLASTDRIIFPGFVDRYTLSEYYRNADLFVFPSFYEGSPRVVKEAMACGCPAIVSDIPGNRLIDPDGQILRFYNPESVEELKSQIRIALKDKAALSRWGLESHEYIQRFSTTETARNIVRLYESYLESR